MKRAIVNHRRDFAAIVALVVLAAIVVGYVLEHQPAFTFGRSYYTVKAQFATAAAVTPGQGQAVTIAGVEVGQVGGVALKHGRAVVTMDLFRRYAPIYRNATVLLRPRTPLKDMYLSLDPGTPSAGRIPDGGTLPVGATQPDIDVDQILGSLDADTRTYLLLLLSGGATAFRGPGANAATGTPSPVTTAQLRGLFKRFAPLNRDTRAFAGLLAKRSANLRRAIHNLGLVAGALGGVDNQLASLVRASNANFGAIASQQSALQAGLTLLPGTLQQTGATLHQVQGFAAQSGGALAQLQPFAHELAPALRATRGLVAGTTGTIRAELRPFAVAVQPLARTLAPAARHLATATPKLVSSFAVLNALFNALAFKGSGTQSYLFWGAWLAHNAASLTDMQDAQGPVVNGLFMASCPGLNLLEETLQQSVPSLAPLLDLLNAPNWATIKSRFCPAGGSG